MPTLLIDDVLYDGCELLHGAWKFLACPAGPAGGGCLVWPERKRNFFDTDVDFL